MKLEEIERFGVEIFQASFDKRGQVLPIITGCDMRIEPSPRFRCDVKLFFSFPTELCQQTFTSAVTVNVRGVEEIYTEIERAVKGRQ